MDLDIEWQAYWISASAALSNSDNTILRCYESAVPVPSEWVTYRKALRAIVSQTSGTPGDLPIKPDYPVGT